MINYHKLFLFVEHLQLRSNSISSYYLIDCFESEVVYYGQKLGNPIDPFVGSVEDCHDLCITTEGCNFFTFRKWNRNVCVLRKAKGTVQSNSKSISGSAYKCRKTGNQFHT